MRPLNLAPKSISVFNPMRLEKKGRVLGNPKFENKSAFSKKIAYAQEKIIQNDLD